MRVFILGPGGVGKSTCALLLAAKLGFAFVDLDGVFMQRTGHIGRYIRAHGYAEYARRNSTLFETLLQEHPEQIVFALSSGFLAHDGLEGLVAQHRALLARSGVSLVLLPSRVYAEAVVVARQLARGLGLREQPEREKLRRRYPLYEQASPLRVYSTEAPEHIATHMMRLLDAVGVHQPPLWRGPAPGRLNPTLGGADALPGCAADPAQLLRRQRRGAGRR